MRARFASLARAAAACATVVCALPVLAGCGAAEQLARKIDLKQASSWIQDTDALRVTLAVQAEPLAVPAGAGDLLTRTELELVGPPSGRGAPSATTLRVDGTQAIRVVTRTDRVYAQADPVTLRRVAPAGSWYASARLAAAAPMLDLLAPGAGPLARGDWVTSDRERVDAVLARLTGRPLDGDRAVFATIMSRVEQLLRKAAIATDDQNPDHLVLTLHGGDVSAALDGLGELGRSDGLGRLDEVGAWLERLSVPATVRLDAYLRDGELVRMSLDLAQFLDRAGNAPVRLVVGLTEAPPVAVPAEAAELDPQLLVARLSAIRRLAEAGRAEAERTAPGG